MKLLSEEKRIIKGFLGDANAGIESARVSLRKSNAASIVVQLAAGTGTDFEMTLRQHDASTGGTSQDLVSTVPVYHKTDAESVFTRLDVETATVAIDSVDEVAGIVVVEIYQDDLEEGFDHVSLVLGAAGAARIVSVEYLLDTKNKPAYSVEV